jgi:F-type H+-transporting ATPase subunit epsilon
MKTFHLVVAKVGENLFEGDVISVILPGRDGIFQVLANHEALISELKEGEMHIKSADNQTHRFSLPQGGVAEISHSQATILL